MNDIVQATNDIIDAEHPALGRLLSPLGRRLAFPPDIPFQAAQARGKAYNATIGQITDGKGHAVPIPSLVAGLDLSQDELDRAVLYSPIEGRMDLRQAWRAWQRRDVAEDLPSTLPLTTIGLSHGLSLLADLFAGPEHVLAVPAPFWGNYRQMFGVRTGCRVVTAPAWVDGSYDTKAVSAALAEIEEGTPALAILNFPGNPAGWMPTEAEREQIVTGLLAEADRRPLLVIADDAYAGLVYDDVPRRSIFWDLIDRHENLVPVKVDGATKEISFFGGRVGFLTFPFEPDSELAAAVTSKVKCLVRATLGSPVSTSQALLFAAMSSADIDAQVEDVRALLDSRYRTLAAALGRVDRDLLAPLPFNAGCFALIELGPKAAHLDSEAVRLHLLAHEDTGLVSIQPRHLRVAFCSVAGESLDELVVRLERGVRELAAR